MCTYTQLHQVTNQMAQCYHDIYGADIVGIFLYGSYARGDYDNQSDIDIAAIVKGSRLDLQNKLKAVWDISADIGLENDVVVSPTVIPYDEFEEYKEKLPYYRNIARECRLDNLTEYRLANAKEKLESAKLLLDAGKYKDSIGRSYYAIFTSLRAVLSKDGVDFSKHAGVIAYFQREYIKTGIFDKKYSKYVQSAFQIRNSCDYDDFFIASRQDAEEQYQKAEELYEEVKAFLEK